MCGKMVFGIQFMLGMSGQFFNDGPAMCSILMSGQFSNALLR